MELIAIAAALAVAIATIGPGIGRIPLRPGRGRHARFRGRR